MTVSLVLIRPDGGQQDVPVRHQSEVIGRHSDCKIRVPDSSVSRQHCEITATDSGVMIRDLGSSNGTFVNGKRVEGLVELNAGDTLLIGKFVFVVRINGRPEEIIAEDALEDAQPISSGPTRSTSKTTKAPAKEQPPAPSRPSLLEGVENELDKELDREFEMDDSSVMDFDFLDDKDAPKL